MHSQRRFTIAVLQQKRSHRCILTDLSPQIHFCRCIPTDAFPRTRSHTRVPTHAFPHTRSHRCVPTHVLPHTRSHTCFPTHAFPQMRSHRRVPTHAFPQTYSYRFISSHAFPQTDRLGWAIIIIPWQSGWWFLFRPKLQWRAGHLRTSDWRWPSGPSTTTEFCLNPERNVLATNLPNWAKMLRWDFYFFDFLKQRRFVWATFCKQVLRWVTFCLQKC